MRTYFVVPVLITNELTQELVAMQRNQDVTDTLGLQRQNYAFDDRHARVLTRLAITWRLDSFPLNPPSKRVAVEDGIAIAVNDAGMRAARGCSWELRSRLQRS